MEYFAGLVIVGFVGFIAWRIIRSGKSGGSIGGGGTRKEEN